MVCFEKIDHSQFYEAVFMPTASIWHYGPISYRFLREATIIISYRFLFEATGKKSNKNLQRPGSMKPYNFTT